MNNPLKVFITYARTDKAAKDKLIKYLAVMKRSGLIDIWHDTEMLGGDRWQQEIFSKHLPTSDLLLYLVSADSLASENCYKEFEIALQKKIRVVPIIFADCDWKNDQISNFQAFPDDIIPINEWDPEDKGWQNAVKGIRKTIENMLSQAEPASGVSEEEREAKVIFQHGNFLLMLGQIDIALAAYSEAIKCKPDYAEAYVNRGGAYNEKGEFNKSIADLDKAIQLNPELAEAYVNRGNAYSSKDDFQNALENYNMAIELKPDLAEVYVNRGNFYSRKGDFQNALENYNMAIELKPDLAETYHFRGNIYNDKREFQNAIRDYNMAAELNSNFADTYNNRGVVYIRMDEVKRAIEDYSKAIQLKPDSTDAYYNRGEAWLHLQEWDKAKADLTAAKNMGLDIIASFHNEYASVEDFEQKTGIQLPADITVLLTPP